MSRFAEEVAARIVRSLSALLKRKLSIVDSASANAGALYLTPSMSLQFDGPGERAPRALVSEIASLLRFR